jgi:hypothetical protein
MCGSGGRIVLLPLLVPSLLLPAQLQPRKELQQQR